MSSWKESTLWCLFRKVTNNLPGKSFLFGVIQTRLECQGRLWTNGPSVDLIKSSSTLCPFLIFYLLCMQNDHSVCLWTGSRSRKRTPVQWSSHSNEIFHWLIVVNGGWFLGLDPCAEIMRDANIWEGWPKGIQFLVLFLQRFCKSGIISKWKVYDFFFLIE